MITRPKGSVIIDSNPIKDRANWFRSRRVTTAARPPGLCLLICFTCIHLKKKAIQHQDIIHTVQTHSFTCKIITPTWASERQILRGNGRREERMRSKNKSCLEKSIRVADNCGNSRSERYNSETWRLHSHIYPIPYCSPPFKQPWQNTPSLDFSLQWETQ